MKRLTLAAALLLVSAAGALAQDYGLPELHVIRTATLAPSYSCRPVEEFQQGYQQTALFLSAYSKERNSPDLLFNGACHSDDYFEASTAGDDFAFLIDLGPELRLDDLSAQDILHLHDRRTRPNAPYLKDAPLGLAPMAKVLPGHTYAVFLNKSDIRGLFAFRVKSYDPNRRVEIEYAVKEYQVMRVSAQSPGFSWEQKNSAAPDQKPVMEKTKGTKEN